MERDAFLSRVRAASIAVDADLALAYEPGPLTPDLAHDDAAAAFTRNLQAVDGVVHHAAQRGDVPGIVGKIIAGYDAANYVAWDELPVPGVLEHVAAMDLARLPTELPADPTERRRLQLDYMDLTIGITGASAGMAESGSIVLATGPGRPRMASLIPLVHIALLSRERIYPSLSHYAAAHPVAAMSTANLVFITGPSRTGDIEMQLNLGVHGPRSIHVVLVPEG